MMNRRAVQSVTQYAGLLGVLAVLIAFFSVFTDNFFQSETLITIANSKADLVFVSVGMTLVLIVGGIDLSVGSVLALGSMITAIALKQYELGLFFAVILGVLATAICGLFNGAISVWFRIPSFIVTLGMLEIARGATNALTNSKTVYAGSAVESFGSPLSWLPLSPAFLCAILVVVAGQFLLSGTVYGRYCVAVGTNEEAVRMSGIRTAPIKIVAFVISGILCGVAGFAQLSRLSAANPDAAAGLELSAIAACVVGGTSLMGGRGSVIATFLGVMIIAVLQMGLAQMGVDDAMKQIVTGSVIILAVLLDAFRIKLEKRQD